MPLQRRRGETKHKKVSSDGSGTDDQLATMTSSSGSPWSSSTIAGSLRRQPVWIVLAVSSGACAAFNGVFAKLTTTALTTSLASHVSTFLSLSPDNKAVELAVRAFFFGMNLAFNGAMWALFTAALTRGDSTTRVSIVNVSANFLVTAVLGWMVFGEKLPALWWVGASLLAAGNVVIGMRESAEKPGGTIGLDETRDEAVAAEEEQEELLWRMERGRHSNHGHDPEDGDLVELDETDSSGGKTQARTRTSLRTSEEEARIQKGNEVDAPI